jgi:predicted nucleic acid-binding protein
MTELVADTSALVSLGIVDGEPMPICLLESEYDLLVPDEVYCELGDIASYGDDHGRAASRILDRLSDDNRRSVELDREFPLDDGENAAVSLANERGSALFLCDEFNSLGLIHASLADTRLVRTPTLLSSLTKRELLTAAEACSILDSITAARSWDGNSYVQRARSRLETD